MGFGGELGLVPADNGATTTNNKSMVSDRLLHQLECRACPLNHAPGLRSPKMLASGAREPSVYIIGEAPGCVSGDTPIEVAYRDKSVCPSGIPIRELAGKSGFHVYSFDVVRQELVLGLVTKVWKTGRKRVFRVTYEWWDYQHKKMVDSIKVTSNHLFLLKRYIPHDPFGSARRHNSDYLSIDQGLIVGDGLQPFTRRYVEQYSLIGTSSKNIRREGRFLLSAKMGRDLERGEDCHHDDENKLNDSWDNLKRLTTADHAREHTLKLNPMDRVGARVNHEAAVTKEEYREALRQKTKEYLADPVNYDQRKRQLLLAGEQTRFQKGRENHRVIDIEELGIEDVYDLEVERWHNFATNGIFVHNSTEDREGTQFVGESGDLLRPYIPAEFLRYIRWNNTLRCRPPDNRDPERIERECCRPSIERDIASSQPDAIFGMGAQPLSWAGRIGGIYLWRGRRFPIKIGDHVCWYYPMLHPAGIIHQRRAGGWSAGDDEFALELDLRRAFADVADGLPQAVVHTAEFARSNITCLAGRKSDDLDYLLDFLKYAGAQNVTGVDYETQNLRPYNKDSELLTAAVATEAETVSFALRHPGAGWSDRQLALIDAAWMKFLQSRAKKAVHQLSFEMEWTCYQYGNEFARSVPWEDTMTQAYVLDERVGDIKPGALSLDWLCQQHFGISIKKLSPKMDKARMRDEGLETLLPYNGIDAKYHRLVYLAQKTIIKQSGLVEVYAEKVRQVPTVVLTQLKGIPLDATVNKELRREYARKLAKAEAAVQAIPEAQKFRTLSREPFNPGSPRHVITMLRDILNTRAGQTGPGWSTKEAVLKEVRHPIAAAVLNYRKVQKIKGTYVDPYSPDGPNVYPGNIIHTNLGTCFTETGRLNSENPNVQNVPVRTPEGRKARKQIAAKVMASFDYGQIDARIIACGSRDRHYCKALWEDYDIHKEWAERLAHAVPRLVGGKSGIKDPETMGAFRNHIKSVWVFALFYGAALYTTAMRLECEERELTKLYDAFWSQFAGVRKWQDEISRQFRKLGYVQLFGGLRRHAPLGHGQQINTPVQGATNRVVMLGMNRLSETGDPLLQANMQIHDDLTYCFNSQRDYEDCMPRILDVMLDGKEFPWFCVPLIAEVKTGTNWAEMTKVGNFSSVDRLGWPKRSAEFT